MTALLESLTVCTTIRVSWSLIYNTEFSTFKSSTSVELLGQLATSSVSSMVYSSYITDFNYHTYNIITI